MAWISDDRGTLALPRAARARARPWPAADSGAGAAHHRPSLHARIAGIDGDGEASMRSHAKLDFARVAHLKEVWRKLDRWLDLVFYQRLLAVDGVLSIRRTAER